MIDHRTLLVAGTSKVATDLQHQIDPERRRFVVVSPGQSFAQRFDLILITEHYHKQCYYSSDHERRKMDDWFDTCVLTRLSGPDARLVRL